MTLLEFIDSLDSVIEDMRLLIFDEIRDANVTPRDDYDDMSDMMNRSRIRMAILEEKLNALSETVKDGHIELRKTYSEPSNETSEFDSVD